jgi:S1-C subfamily serine protease
VTASAERTALRNGNAAVRRGVLLLLGLLVTACSGTKTPADIYREASPSVALISVSRDPAIKPRAEGAEACSPGGIGTGFVVDVAGFLLTNNHVVASSCPRLWRTEDLRIQVRLRDGTTLPGRLVGQDPDTDLAVVKIGRSGLRALRFASDRAEVGRDVLAIGFPLATAIGGEATLTRGVIGATGRSAGHGGALAGLVQVDAAINPGNSGGPLLDLRGEVVGVNVAVARDAQGIALAIAGPVAARVAKDLVATGRVGRAVIGRLDGFPVTETGAMLAQGEGMPLSVGLLLMDLEPGSPAAAVLRPCDLVEQIGDAPIRALGDVSNAMLWARPGQTLAVRFHRYPPGKCDLPLTFAEWSRRSSAPPKPTAAELQLIQRRCHGTHAMVAGVTPEVCAKEELAERARARRRAEIEAWTAHNARIPWAQRSAGEARTAQITLR